MALGKKTGGRQKSSRNKTTRAAEIAASGDLPLDYMLRVIRDEQEDLLRRYKMAFWFFKLVESFRAAPQKPG
jgi:hypothetical protein